MLLNVVSFVTKLTDFGMSRAIKPSALSHKSSVKGTLAFMSPEALHVPPRYNEKLDVFSFGNIILSTITHEWPNPGPPTQYKGDQLIALDEFQRRERYVEMFTPQEKQLFLPTVRQCLENRPDKHPSSAILVQEMKRIESSLPSGSHVAAPIEQLQKWLSAKEEECRHKDEALKEKDEALVNKDKMILEKENVIKGKDDALQHLDMIIREQDEALTEKNAMLRKQQDTIQTLQASNHSQRTAIQDQQDVIRVLQDTIRERRYLNQAQHTAVPKQQDAIQVQQAEIEPAVAKQVSCHISS